MDETLRTNLDNIRSKDKELQNKAYFYLLEVTGQPVDWAYEAWHEIVAGLNDKDNHAVKDEEIKEKALALIETEEDLKYRKKYATLWRVKE